MKSNDHIENNIQNELSEANVYIAALEYFVAERYQSRERIKALSKLRGDLLSKGTLKDKLKLISDRVVRIFEADFCRIWITQSGDLCEKGCIHAQVLEGPHVCKYRDRCLHLIASSGRYAHIDGKVHKRVPFGCYKIGRVAADIDPKFITNDVTHDPRVHDRAWAAELGLVSFAGYRLQSDEGRSMGVLALFKKHEISPEEDSQLEDIVFTAAHVIQETAAIEALRESEYKYRRLFENVTDAVMIFEAETQKVVDANKSAVDLYGYTREGLLELKYPYICAQVDDTKISEGGMSKDTGNTGQVGYHRKNDGTIFPVEVSEAVFMLGSSKMICRLVRDITQRLESERLKEQLLQSQKMEAIGTLAGGIAHDFNNILYALIGYAKLAILESDPNCNVHDYLKQIEIAGHRAAELVRQILAFSRQSEGTQRPVKLQAIISETIALLRGTLPATVEIYQRVSDDCPPVETDGVQINQMLMNLCTNAFQAMQDRRGVLEIGLDEVIVTKEQAARVEGLRPGKYARLVVTDNGVGMSESVAKRVFDPYFTTKRPGQGSGLGLSIVHGIIKSHKGAINIVSSPGQGTKCEVYLPIKCSDGNDYEEPENQERGEAWTGTGHILFVDDEKMITDMADNILSDHGYRVSAFTDSTKALAAFRESPMSYDLVISDITMPKTTGIELSQEIRRHRPDIPIILCTGYSDVLDLEWAENFGIEACLEKPIDLVYLKRVIWEALEFRPVKEA